VACAHVQPALSVKAHAPALATRLLTSGFGRRPEWTYGRRGLETQVSSSIEGGRMRTTMYARPQTITRLDSKSSLLALNNDGMRYRVEVAK
jgi:hypothetical protein